MWSLGENWMCMVRRKCSKMKWFSHIRDCVQYSKARRGWRVSIYGWAFKKQHKTKETTSTAIVTQIIFCPPKFWYGTPSHKSNRVAKPIVAATRTAFHGHRKTAQLSRVILHTNAIATKIINQRPRRTASPSLGVFLISLYRIET